MNLLPSVPPSQPTAALAPRAAEDSTPLKAEVVLSNATEQEYAVTDLDLVRGRRYAVCVRAINCAGYASARVCTNGAEVGGEAVDIARNATGNTTVLLDPASLGDRRLPAYITIPAGAVPPPNGTPNSTGAVRTVTVDFQLSPLGSGDPYLPDAEVANEANPGGRRYVGQSFSINVAGSPADGEQLLKAVYITLQYDGTWFPGSDSAAGPVLKIFRDGRWLNAADTCPEPWSHFDPLTRLYTVAVCHFSFYSVQSHVEPVAVLAGPRVVTCADQACSNGSVAVVFNASESYDPDLPPGDLPPGDLPPGGSLAYSLCIVNSSVTAEAVKADEAPQPCLPFAVEQVVEEARAWLVKGLSPSYGNLTAVLRVVDLDGGVGVAVIPIRVNRPPRVHCSFVVSPGRHGCVTATCTVSDMEDDAADVAVEWTHTFAWGPGGVPPDASFQPMLPGDGLSVSTTYCTANASTASRTCGYDMCGFVSNGTQWLRATARDLDGGATAATAAMNINTTVHGGGDIVQEAGTLGDVVFPLAVSGVLAHLTQSVGCVVDAGEHGTVRAVVGGLTPTGYAVNVTVALGTTPWEWVPLTCTVRFSGGNLPVTRMARVRRNVAPVAQVQVGQAGSGDGAAAAPDGGSVTLTIPDTTLLVTAGNSTDDMGNGTVLWTVVPLACAVPDVSLGAIPPGDARLYCVPYNVTVPMPGDTALLLNAPGVYLVTCVLTDVDGAVSAPVAVRVEVVWPRLAPALLLTSGRPAQLADPAGEDVPIVLVGQPTWPTLPGLGMQVEDPRLVAWLHRFNTTTQWLSASPPPVGGGAAVVPGPEPAPRPLSPVCSQSSMCWLQRVQHVGNYTVRATLALAQPTEADPTARVTHTPNVVYQRVDLPPVAVVRGVGAVVQLARGVVEEPGWASFLFNATESFDPNGTPVAPRWNPLPEGVEVVEVRNTASSVVCVVCVRAHEVRLCVWPLCG
jgi:hypothetical protein